MQGLNFVTAFYWDRDDKTLAFAKRLREQPDVEDAFARHNKLLPNGRFIHDMLAARVKALAESKYAWDFSDILGVVPAAEAFRAIEQSKCKLR